MKTPQLDTSLALLCATLVAAACGGGSDSPSGGNAGPSVGDSLTGLPAEQASELEIRQKAALNASTALGINLSDAFSLQVDDTGLGDTIDDSDMVDEEVDDFMQVALGLDGSNASIEREGNLITIDLDDTAICNETLADRAGFMDDFEECLQIAQQFLVQVDAVTDDTGRIHFLFQEQPVVSIGYAPNLGSYELSLPGFFQMTTYINDLRGFAGSVPETLTGALLVEAEVEGNGETVSAARLSLHISQALRIADSSTNTDISIGQSEVVSFQANADDSVSVSTDMGAINALYDISSESTSVDEFGNVTTESTGQSTVALAVSAVTAQLDVAADGQSARLRNAGIGNAPLSLQIDGEQALSLTLNEVSMTLSPESIDFDSNLTLGLMLGEAFAESLTGDDPEGNYTSAEAAVSIPAGSSLVDQDNGSTRVDSGSLSLQVSATGAQGSVSQSFDASAGQCFDDDDSDSGELQLVECDPR
ncbi:hypothetical protein ACUNV4_14055 [Granulosicoccus sp. 3-233]|uniref:hypothetical protein n=1 Tax=Granulosicoccus sp. 3-233 TaxID=3417969 RepID=UPI003D325A91